MLAQLQLHVDTDINECVVPFGEPFEVNNGVIDRGQAMLERAYQLAEKIADIESGDRVVREDDCVVFVEDVCRICYDVRVHQFYLHEFKDGTVEFETLSYEDDSGTGQPKWISNSSVGGGIA